MISEYTIRPNWADRAVFAHTCLLTAPAPTPLRVYVGADLALVMDVLPKPDDSGKDLGVFTIANGLPRTLAPVLAAVLLAVGSATNQNDDLMLYAAAAMALTAAVIVLPIKGVR